MSDEYGGQQADQPTPPTPSPIEEPGPTDPAASPSPIAEDTPPSPPQDVVTTADDVTRPAVTAAAPTAPGIPDETHNSIDPQTGALTVEALARRDEIVRLVQEAGHAVGSFEEALKHWIEMEGAKSPPGDLS